MGEYNEKDLDKVSGAIDPRFVEETIPEPNDPTALTEEELAHVFPGMPYRFAGSFVAGNEQAYREAAIDRLLEDEEFSHAAEQGVTKGGRKM